MLEHHGQFSLVRMASALRASRSGFHRWVKNRDTPRRLTENSARSEDGRKLRMKIRFYEENSELFDE